MADLQPDQQAALQQTALAYLQEQLGPRAPQWLRFVGAFDEQVLEGEGLTAFFAFELPPTEGAATHADSYDPQHHVAVGETSPNYYPAYGLAPDEAYSLHLGTQFLLTLGANVLPEAEEPDDAREKLRQIIANTAPDAPVSDIHPEALFRCADQVFVVYRLKIGPEEVYFMGADCPPGFYRRIDLPAAVALRLHLGQVVRQEKS